MEGTAAKQVGYSLVLESGKKVVIREPKIKHRSIAAQAVGSRAGDNQLTFFIMMSEEMIRQIVYCIDGKVMTPPDLFDLDSVFSTKEYAQMERVYKSIAGEDKNESPLAPKLEIVTIGNS